jgi:Na+/proline symporter
MQDREGMLVARTTIVVMVVLGVLIGGSDVLKLIISYSFLAFAFRADAMLVPVLVAVIGPRLRLNTAGAGVGALAGGIITNIGWNLMVSQGGAAEFIGLAGSVVGLMLGHGVWVLSGGKHIAPPVYTTTTDAPRRVSLEG